MDPELVAEDLMAFVPVPPTGDRAFVPGACLTFVPGPHPYFGNVAMIRTSADDLDRLVDTARGWFAARGRRDFTWFLGPSATPSELAQLLEARGAVVGEPCTVMLLESRPSTGPADVDVREVVTREQLATFRELLFFQGEPNPSVDHVQAVAAGLDGAWRDMQAMTHRRRAFLAYVDDEPVSAGGVTFTEHGVAVLAGGATSERARGRGCYRALVDARWKAAAGAGCTTIAVHASNMSRPILSRLGFRVTTTMTVMHQSTQAAG